MRANALRTLWKSGGAAVNGWLAIPNSFVAEMLFGFQGIATALQGRCGAPGGGGHELHLAHGRMRVPTRPGLGLAPGGQACAWTREACGAGA